MTKGFSKAKFLRWATFTGWGGVLIVDILTLIFFEQGQVASLIFTITIGYVVIGLPIAFVLCFALGWPIITMVGNNRPITQRNMLILGMSLGAIFGSANFILMINEGFKIWMLSLDWLSTVLVGGAAGHVGFKKANINVTLEQARIFD